MEPSEQSPAADDDAPTPEQIPGGRYHMVKRLSTGALGAVYMALDTILDRPVAVKVVRLDSPFADNTPDELRERFVREARIAARLQHSNIVTIHDIIAHTTRGFIIMEFIEGQSLESLLAEKKRLPLSEAIRMMEQLASALDYAHERKVVHRDVKPSNILVSSSSPTSVWITDFGVAKSELSTNLTMAGGVLGTPDYMSPEQAKGEDVDARSDLFSLGCVLFECAIGEKPFRSPSLTGVLLSIINDEPVFPLNWASLGLPTGLKPVLHHALEKNRERRFESGAALVAALRALSPTDIEKADAIVLGDSAKLVESEEAGDKEETKTESSEADENQEEAAAEKAAAEKAAAEKAAAEKAAAEKAAAEKAAAEKAAAEKAAAEKAAAEKAAAEKAAAEKAAAEKAAAEKAAAEKTAAEKEAAEKEAAEKEAAEKEAAEKAAAEKAAAEKAAAEKAAAEKAAAEKAAAEKAAAEKAAAEKAAAEKAAAEKAAAEKAAAEAVTPAMVEELKGDSRILKLSPTLSGALHDAEITPEEGFLLSRIDGASRPAEIMAISPMPELETARVLFALLEKGLVHQGSPERQSRPKPAKVRVTAPKSEAELVDEALIRELDKLLAHAAKHEHAELLGIEKSAPEKIRKRAYLKVVGKFHPDKFSRVTDKTFKDKLSKVCAAAADAVDELAKPQPEPSKSSPGPQKPTNGTYGGSTSSFTSSSGRFSGQDTGSFDKRRHARELYDRALRSFDLQDFWDAIQLCNQAIEADDRQAEYFCLLGRALMQNKRWRKDAAKNFRKATELDPNNLEYLGLLGALYQSEGLSARASSVLKQAQTLDPDFVLPDIDGDVSVEAH